MLKKLMNFSIYFSLSLSLCLILIILPFAIYAQGSFSPVIDSPFATGATPQGVAFTPNIGGNIFAAVANSGGGQDTVSVYAVDPATGEFTPVPGSPFATGATPVSVAFSPFIGGNLFAAVTNDVGGSVSVYTVNTTTGVFTPIAGSPFATGGSPVWVAYSPNIGGNVFAAVANATSNNVTVYSVNTTTGAFTPVAGSPFATGTNPRGLDFSPDVGGNVFAAVVNATPNTVSVYAVNGTTGVFTPVAGSPFATGASPQSVAFSPVIGGNVFAAVGNENGNTVSVYAVNTTTGAFTPVAGSPFAAGLAPEGVAFSPNIGGLVFAAVANNTSSSVSVYEVNPATGVFTPVLGSPFAAGTFSHHVTFSQEELGNLYAAVTNSGDNTVSVYSVALPPTVTSVNPSIGPGSGGTNCLISGTQFTGVTGVSFGGTPATFFFINSNRILAVSPPGVGTVDVTVTTPAGTSVISPADEFTYISFIPSVLAVCPSQGPLNGGTQVTITGSNFTGATAVLFGAIPAASFTVVSASQIIATSPPGTGTVDITVTTPIGTSPTSSSDQFTYTAATNGPSVFAACPLQGPVGTQVTITGSNFTGATAVFFGTVPATSFTVLNASQIVAIAPPGIGTVDILVVTPSGTSTVSPGDTFTYILLPSPVMPPRNLEGFQRANKFLTQEDIINILTWAAPSQTTPAIVAYKIFQNRELSQLIAVIPNKTPLQFIQHNRKKGKTYIYYVVSVDQFGNLSVPAQVTIGGH